MIFVVAVVFGLGHLLSLFVCVFGWVGLDWAGLVVCLPVPWVYFVFGR